jgi:hypothetical protein
MKRVSGRGRSTNNHNLEDECLGSEGNSDMQLKATPENNASSIFDLARLKYFAIIVKAGPKPPIVGSGTRNALCF